MTDNLKYLKEHNVLLATNGNIVPGSLSLQSIDFYRDLIDNNFIYIQAKRFINDKLSTCYGLQGFIELILWALKNKYEYIIYIDDDCFITNKNNLLEAFKDFVNSNAIISGPTDGGTYKTRTHNIVSLNPFLSFFNLKYFKNFETHIQEIFNFDMKSIGVESKLRATENFKNALLKINESIIFNKSRAKEYKNKYPTFKIENEWALDNYEPYYKLFLWIALNIQGNIKYMNAVDYYCDEDPEGITTAVYYNNYGDENKLICLHTWYARCLAYDSYWYDSKKAERINNVYKLAVKKYENKNK